MYEAHSRFDYLPYMEINVGVKGVLARSRGPGKICLKAQGPGLILSPGPMNMLESVPRDPKIP